MKAILAIMSLSILTACVSVPVKRNFPEIPESLTKTCEPLNMVPKTDKLSEVLLVVTDNYSLYHECSLKVDAWQNWYQQQRNNFDSVK